MGIGSVCWAPLEAAGELERLRRSCAGAASTTFRLPGIAPWSCCKLPPSTIVSLHREEVLCGRKSLKVNRGGYWAAGTWHPLDIS